MASITAQISLPHSQLNEELSENSSHLKQSDIELLGLLIKNFTPDSFHKIFFFVLTLQSHLFSYFHSNVKNVT